jgi:hypothetical protein
VAIFDGGHWSKSSLGAVLGSATTAPTVTVQAADIGPLGVAVVVGGQSTPDVLFSQDGTTWSVQPLSQFVAAGVGQVTNVVVTANRAIVAIQLPNPNPTGPAPVAVVVGTPA